MDKMTINVKMLCPLMKNKVFSNMESCLIITPEWNRKFTHGIGKTYVFCFKDKILTQLFVS
ncbi:hypothetical protein Scep_027325 [Stephania cephalantha]|uniref:Uncharacterized protein n=1 Tax=Stephania cephalantha TaxID=152367 RepID=A0AAP0HH58_9MAGN